METIATDGTATTTLHQRYLYRGYLQIACCDLTRDTHPCLWLITWDPTQPIATRPLAIQKDATWYTYGWDLTKNVCEVFSNEGYINNTVIHSYTPYGAVTAEGSVTQPIQWSSEFYDDELGLVYYNYRHYNPSSGKWIARDSIQSHNLYIYSHNNSVFNFDILGMAAYRKKIHGDIPGDNITTVEENSTFVSNNPAIDPRATQVRVWYAVSAWTKGTMRNTGQQIFVVSGNKCACISKEYRLDYRSWYRRSIKLSVNAKSEIEGYQEQRLNLIMSTFASTNPLLEMAYMYLEKMDIKKEEVNTYVCYEDTGWKPIMIEEAVVIESTDNPVIIQCPPYMKDSTEKNISMPKYSGRFLGFKTSLPIDGAEWNNSDEKDDVYFNLRLPFI